MWKWGRRLVELGEVLRSMCLQNVQDVPLVYGLALLSDNGSTFVQLL